MFVGVANGKIDVVCVVSFQIDSLLSEVDGFDSFYLSVFESTEVCLANIVLFTIAGFFKVLVLEGVHSLDNCLNGG